MTCLLKGTILTHIYYISRYKGYIAYIRLFNFCLTISVLFTNPSPFILRETVRPSTLTDAIAPLCDISRSSYTTSLASKLLESMDSG